jgi:hypothetical protein
MCGAGETVMSLSIYPSLLRHHLLLPGKKDFARFDIPGQLYLGGANVAATAALGTRIYVVTFRHIQQVTFNRVGDLRRA